MLYVGIKHKGEIIVLAEFDEDTGKEMLQFMRTVSKKHDVYIACGSESDDGE